MYDQYSTPNYHECDNTVLLWGRLSSNNSVLTVSSSPPANQCCLIPLHSEHDVEELSHLLRSPHACQQVCNGEALDQQSGTMQLMGNNV